ncbi:PadR family transcriptional regulator [Methylomonas rosea]|uniref:PadR family transcriptional regulator n=1 Tax=Methylomonas rosea TaxID=2952227 RepID=A0ABT1TTV6_9GAMM|nr:PadR family transcriptional regulator [Methylomonas sp. WSC-7]MCQ8118213.1 PadR family transcriptional regulator [Methylomonas sp. WSC-7]
MKTTEKESKTVSMGDLERFILLAILNNRNNSYGVEIRQDIKEKIGKDVSVGALYTTLDRLETKGLIKSREGEATDDRGGRAKKYFQVSALGHNSLNQSLREISLMANVNPIAI